MHSAAPHAMEVAAEDAGHKKCLLLVAALVAGLAKQLTVLLLRHALAALLNN